MILLPLLLLTSFTGFSQAESDRITAKNQDWTFTLKATMADFPSRHALEEAAHSCVDAPDNVCVVVDPGHHWTSVHYGTSTSVSRSDYNTIAAAGNSYFKQGDFAGGIIAIGERAMVSVKNTQSAASVVPPVTSTVKPSKPTTGDTTGDSWLWFGLFMAVLASAIVFVWYRLSRRQKKLDEDMSSYREERNEYLDANVDRIIKTDSAPKSRPPPPAPMRPSAVVPQTVVHEHYNSSNNDMLTGVLLGQAMSSPPPAPPAPPVVVVHETPSYSPPSRSSSSDDSSSSSSSWGSDSGSGGSDWGGGGGFDGGGGGSDW